MKESRAMDDTGMELLCVEIIKQAALDYWHDCAKGNYKRPDGMKDRDFEKYVFDSEFERKKRKKEEQGFFRSKWFRTIFSDDSITGDMFMKRIEYLRSINKVIVFQGIRGEEDVA